jgi:hypothetical protein
MQNLNKGIKLEVKKPSIESDVIVVKMNGKTFTTTYEDLQRFFDSCIKQ